MTTVARSVPVLYLPEGFDMTTVGHLSYQNSFKPYLGSWNVDKFKVSQDPSDEGGRHTFDFACHQVTGGCRPSILQYVPNPHRNGYDKLEGGPKLAKEIRVV